MRSRLLTLLALVALFGAAPAMAQDARGERGEAAPSRLAIEAARPNPFADQTTLQYAVPRGGEVQVTVYDVLGRPVARLVRQRQEAGVYSVTWDGRINGADAPPGLYLIAVQSGDDRAVRRVTRLR
jgi:hypothetical protein